MSSPRKSGAALRLAKGHHLGDGIKANKTERRNAIAYIHVKKANKSWLYARAKKMGLSVSAFGDGILDQLRTRYPVQSKKAA